MQKMIIDGYNVIYADDRLKAILKGDLQGARRELIKWLTRYLGEKNVQMTLVFDGHGGITDVDVQIPGRLQLLYSSVGQSADEVIIDILKASPNPRQYIVVTSDMADIGRTARTMGAKVLSSSSFLSRICREDSNSRTESSVGDDADDLEFWMKKFGVDDGEDGKE